MPFDERLRSRDIDQLFKAMMSLESLEEFYQLFEDLCTVNELQAMAQRLRAAQLLDQGATYDQVVRETGMSTATISRIKRFLNYGADGYKLVLERLEESEGES